MTRYQILTNLGDDLIKLMAKNIIPVHILDWKVYYEAYLREMEATGKSGRTKKTRAAGIVAENYKLSERNVFKIIAYMEG